MSPTIRIQWLLYDITNGVRNAQSGSVRHKIYTKTETYSVQTVRFINKSTLDNSTPPLNLKLLRPQGQIIDVKCKK